MEIIVEEARSKEACLKKIQKKYGTGINIVRSHCKEISYLFGIFSREKHEISFTVNSKNNPLPSKEEALKKINFDEAKTANFIDAQARRIKFIEGTEKEKAENTEDTSEKLHAEKIAEKNFDDVKNLINELAEKIRSQSPGSETEHINIKKIISLMEENDFSFSFINGIISRIKTELTFAQLEDFPVLRRKVLDFIAESINIKPLSNTIEKKVIILVGPTGVGKTTTLAKLAAFYKSKLSARLGRKIKVKVITTDMYRIGAAEQVRRFCELMDIELTKIDSLKDFKVNVDLCKSTCDIVFVDTTGRSPGDSKQIEYMQSYFSAVNREDTEIHLVISAVTKISDMKKIIESYNVFNFENIIITKLDETLHCGNVVSVLSETDKPVSYITTGQGVPKDIMNAGKKAFVKKLEGFEEDSDYINENFDDISSMNWG